MLQRRRQPSPLISTPHQCDSCTDLKIARPFHTYGPGMELDDGRVFADFIADVVHGRNIVMHSDGSAIRAFCYLVDATLGFFTVLLKEKEGEAYNVANDNAVVSIAKLANILTSLFPEKILTVLKQDIPRSPFYLKSPIARNVPDVSKLKQLNWTAKYDIANGFSRTILSFS